MDKSYNNYSSLLLLVRIARLALVSRPLLVCRDATLLNLELDLRFISKEIPKPSSDGYER